MSKRIYLQEQENIPSKATKLIEYTLMSKRIYLQKPQSCIGRPAEDVGPGGEHLGVDLVVLVKRAQHNI
jgi:hypothetical protein